MIMFHLMKKENPSLTVKDEDVDKKLKEIEKDEGKDKLEKDLKEAGISLDECKFLIKQSLYEEAFYADYFKKIIFFSFLVFIIIHYKTISFRINLYNCRLLITF